MDRQQLKKCVYNFSEGQDRIKTQYYSCYIKLFFLLLFFNCYNFCVSQEVSWQKFYVDSNLTIEFPGLAKKGASFKMDKYSYDAYSYETSSAMFFVMVGTSEQEIEVYNKEDYEDALSDMAKGARKAAEEKGWITTFTDVTIDNVPGKKMTYNGKLASLDTKNTNYFFLVNGSGYTVSTIFLRQQLSSIDSVDMNHFISSIDFTDNIRENQFDTRSENMAYAIGKIIGGLVVLGVIMLIVILIVRRL